MFARLDKVFKAQSMLIKNFLQLVTICASFLQSSFFLIPIIYYLLRTSPVLFCRLFPQNFSKNTVKILFLTFYDVFLIVLFFTVSTIVTV